MKPNETSISENSSENLHVDEYDQLSDLEKIQLSTLSFNNVTSIADNLSKINQINQYNTAISNAMSLANNLPKFTSIPQIPNISSIMSQYTNILSNMHLNSFTIAHIPNIPQEVYQYSNILSQISIPTIPNHICTAIQQSIRIQDKISYNKDLISSFTSKLKDTEYYDETLVNNLEDINPLLNELEKFPEYQEQFMQKAYSYINEIVETKVEEELQKEIAKVKTSITTKIAISTILVKAHEYISDNISALCDFYNIAPDSMKSDISLICFWLVVVLFAIPVIDFYYNYFNK